MRYVSTKNKPVYHDKYADAPIRFIGYFDKRLTKYPYRIQLIGKKVYRYNWVNKDYIKNLARIDGRKRLNKKQIEILKKKDNVGKYY